MTVTTESTAPSSLDRVRRWWPGWRDAVCLVLLVTVTFHLVSNDGGRPLSSMLPVLVLSAVALIAALPTLRRSPRWLQLLALAWVAGPLISLVFADVRAGWVRPVAAWAIAVPVLFATLQLLRRRWGGTAILAIVGLALGVAWYNGFLVWWAGGTARGEPAWMTLSWHNQSGTLMAVLGVGGLGAALSKVGWPRIVGVIAAAAGLSAAWLSGSRGAVLTAAAAAIVVVLIAARRPAERQILRTGVVTVITVALTAAAVFALAPIWASAGAGTPGAVDRPTGITAQPVSAREQDAAGNLRARFGHWEAAVRMFVQSPLTGTGPGSYRWSSRPDYPEDTNLTASAHSEQLEALGELGLVGGVAALAVTLGLAWLIVGVIRRPGPQDLEVIAAGVATLLAAHAALDFDWDYPVLLALLAIATAGLLAARDVFPGEATAKPPSPFPLAAAAHVEPINRHSHRGEAPPSRAEAPTAAAPSTALRRSGAVLPYVLPLVSFILVVIAATGIILQLRGVSDWQLLDAQMAGAITAAEDGDRPAVEERLQAIATWNPGSPRRSDVEALTGHLLDDVTDEELAATIDHVRSAHIDQVRAAQQLLVSGRPDLTLSIVEDLRPVLDRRRVWGIRDSVARAADVGLAAHHQRGGCDDVGGAWPELRAWLEDHGLDAAGFIDAAVTGQTEVEMEDKGAAWRGCELTTLRAD